MDRIDRIETAQHIISELEELRPQVKALLQRDMPNYRLLFSGHDECSYKLRFMLIFDFGLLAIFTLAKQIFPSIDEYFVKMTIGMLSVTLAMVIGMMLAPCFTSEYDLTHADGSCWLFCSERSIDWLARALEQYRTELNQAVKHYSIQ